jgi:hypothetical protein
MPHSCSKLATDAACHTPLHPLQPLPDYRSRKKPPKDLRTQSVFEACGTEDASCNTPTSAASDSRWTVPAGRDPTQDQPPYYGHAHNIPPATSHALVQELEYYKSQCARQGQELQGMGQELQQRMAEGDALKGQLNLERVKFELLVDLVRAGCFIAALR